MARKVDTYSTRGFVHTAVFSLVVTGLSATFLYLSAPERLRCERGAGGRVTCQLTRTVAGIAVRDRALGVVQGAKVEYSTPSASRAGERQRTQVSNSWVVYFTAGGWVEGVQSESASEHLALVNGLTAFLSDTATRTFEARVGGHPIIQRYGPWAFGVGAGIVPLWLVGFFFPATRPKR